ICIIEIVLGVLTLLGLKMKIVSSLLIGMMLFFTFLTWHTANCDPSSKFKDRDRYESTNSIGQEKAKLSKENKDIIVVSKNSSELVIDEMKQPQCVEDCGCFGDALKGSVGRSLTPSESLWKDIILSYFGIWLLLAAFKKGKIESSGHTSYIIGGFIVILFFSWVFSWYFPLLFTGLALLGALWCLGAFKSILMQNTGVILWSTLLCVLMIAYVLAYDPIKDYRAYAVDSNLKERMNDGQEGKYENLLVYENLKTGENREYDASSKKYIESKIWENKSWKYKEMTQKEIIPMRIPSITEQFNPTLTSEAVSKFELELPFVSNFFKAPMIPGLRIYDKTYKSNMEIPMEEYSIDGFPISQYVIIDTIEVKGEAPAEISLREYIISEKQIFVMVAKKIEDANWSNINRYKEILNLCKEKGIPMILLVSSGPEQVQQFRKKYHFNIPIFINDETELKAITRSNPALLIIENGVVKEKYPHRSTPSAKWINENLIELK
ncbi:MAG: hypothetical protein KJ941_04465, partial [Bacteroidetes bacterium]|nr:hypothetical protein [Bacteroidota bacterium]